MSRYLLFFFLFSILSFAQPSALESTNTRIVELSPYINLKVYSGISITLHTSDTDSLVIRSETPEEVVAVLKGNTLKLRLGLEYLLQKSETSIEVHHSQPLDLIDLSQGSQLTTEEPIEQTSLSLVLQEGSMAEIELSVSRLNAKVQSGAKLFPFGNAKNVVVSCTSGGVCEADQLSAEQVDVKASFGSVAYVKATALVDAKASVNSTIRVHGTPTKLISKESVGGKVIEMK